jgi:hypothetical protein
MAKMSPEERAELEARLAEDDEDDGDDEVTISRGDGTSFTGKFRRALQLGYVTLPEAKTPAKGKAGDSGEGGEVKRFTSGRRTG